MFLILFRHSLDDDVPEIDDLFVESMVSMAALGIDLFLLYSELTAAPKDMSGGERQIC